MKLINWVQLGLLVGLLSFGLGVSIFEKGKLSKCSKQHTAVVAKIDYRKKRGYFAHHTYHVNGKEYKSSASIKSKPMLNKVSVDSEIDILIACDSPQISRIIPE